jgi:CheY-like chemotaxis protein
MTAVSQGVILHVDDEPSIREAVSMLLSGDGYGVTGAANGAQALQLAGQGLRPDVLIVDFNLDQEMNGAQVVQRLGRILGHTPPIIMLTGDPAGAELPWIADAFVWLARKPLNPRLLLAALPGLVQLSRATRGIS